MILTRDDGRVVPSPVDEQPHQPPDGAPSWSESWSFDFAAADGELGGWVRFTRLADRCWYHALLAGPHRQLVAVLDHDVPFRSNPLELRTAGLWADHVCETPLDHWTLGLEAFAVGIDDPLELYGRQLGDRVALGFDLEWETDGPVLARDGGPGVEGYEIPCRVHGEVLVGHEVIDFEGVGSRDHRWGAIDWWSDDGWHLTGVVEGDRHWSVEHRAGTTVAHLVDPGGGVRTVEADAELQVDDDGLPVAARVLADGHVLRSEVLATTPALLEDGDRRARRPRALCRHRTGDGWIGVGWIEVRGDGHHPLAPG